MQITKLASLLAAAGSIVKMKKPRRTKSKTVTKLMDKCKRDNLPVTFALMNFGDKR